MNKINPNNPSRAAPSESTLKETSICESILSNTLAFMKAAKESDIDKMECAAAEQLTLLDKIRLLEQEAAKPCNFPKGKYSSESNDALVKIIKKTLEANTMAQNAGSEAIATLKFEIEKIDAGKKMIQSYGGAVTQPPRFTDKRR